MKYLPDPAPVVKALAALLEAVDPGGSAAARWRAYTDAERAEFPPGQAAELDAKASARAILELATDPAVHGVPVLEKYGCPDGDLDELLSYMDAALAALAALRLGELVLDGSRDPATLARLADSLTAVGHGLTPRVAGLLEALTNAHYDAGGSHPELARALHANHATVAKRSIRRKVSGPSEWEKWALGESEPSEHPAIDIRPGWIMFDANGKRHQVQTVSVYSDGLVEIAAGGTGAFCYRPGETLTAVERPVPFVEATGKVTDPRSGYLHPNELDVTTYTRARRTPAA